MERTESKIVQVAPSYENNKIQELQVFGWNLHGRQEIHEEGDAEGGPDLIGNGYTITTKVNKYVKLHMIRSMEEPNLARIRQLEAEYNAMPRPKFPALVPGGFPLVFFWILPWLTIYLPFFYPRKKRVAEGCAAALRQKFEVIASELQAAAH